ncbi:MAG: UvrD-helicase domain-containing protein, partial [Phycisphaerales bacterium]|nr:UvrD-helicase domain-containing protein [Phycisphaerales bacterium]
MTRPEPDDLFQDLTSEQALAVRTTEGPVLVLAAAGSGKTRVITRRIAYLVSCGIPAWSILALTFTNKAAGEMRDRVHAILGVDSRAGRGLTVTTFHALCARLLRRHAESDALPRLKPDFTIYPTDDQMALLKRLIDAQGLATSNWPPRQILSAISNAKNDLLDARAFADTANDFYQRTIAKLYLLYEEGLEAANAVDFDDLLLLTVQLLQRDEEALDACRARWTYLMIDEYQDTNRAQFEIASLLAGDGSPNIFVVGDPDQSIYGWREADISNILDFEHHWPEATTITLGQNFRSTEHILGAADSLIRKN